MSLTQKIKEAAAKSIEAIYKTSIPANDILVNQTKPEFEGDYTIVLFAFIKQLKGSPEQLGKQIGDDLLANNSDLFTAYNVIKGFLNLSVSDNYFKQFLSDNFSKKELEKQTAAAQKVMVEYSSPNTNKPLHLGHLRNNFLGWSIAEILKSTGNDVMKTCIVNDRGIHICKSMIAWQLFGNGATPQTTNTKGDHFVGDYYVKFSSEHKKQMQQ
ncbi:MAG: arginine--tRNA ligase domain-containing protein, partial [Flavisolibacter sp.]